jgi:hypothetical protein
VGEASKKKSLRQQGIGQSRSEFERQRIVSLMLANPDKVTVAEAARIWCDGADPNPATIPRWTSDSVGDRFFSAQTIGDAAKAPRLDGAVLPSGREMTAIRSHWEVATNALVRSVVFDGLSVNDPMVGEVITLLTPVLELEVNYQEEEEFSDEMPDETAPLYLLGRNFLAEAVWAVTGDDPLSEVLPLLERRLNAVLTALDPAPGFTGTALAKSLICTLPYDFEFNQPEESEFLECLGCEGCTGHPLMDFVDEGIAPDQALRSGVAAIAAVADLCRTNAESVLDASAETAEP